MSLWSIVEGIMECIDWIYHWRFGVCFFGGIALAWLATNHIAADPLRWIVGGAILIGAAYVGWRWDSAH